MTGDEKSKNQILQAFDALSHTLYQARATRRTTSLALPRQADDGNDDAAGGVDAVPAEARLLSQRLSLMSPFQARFKQNKHGNDDEGNHAAGGVDAVLAEPRLLYRRLSLMSPFRSRSDQDKHGNGDDKDEDDGDHVGCIEAVPAEPRPPSRRLSLMSPFRPRSKEDKHGENGDKDYDDGDDASGGVDAVLAEPRPLSRRLSLMSPFRSRSNQDKRGNDDEGDDAAGGVAARPAELRSRPLSRRLSLTSPFRSMSMKGKHRKDDDGKDDDDDGSDAGDADLLKRQSSAAVTPGAAAADDGKRGIWGWKPMRALSHIGMHRVGCLFSLEVVAAQRLPPSMDGLRLAVAVRRKETRDGALQTMPARAHKGAADFDETLYVRCHLYCRGGGATGKPLRFEARPFLISAVAVDAPELDFGKNAVDLSSLVKEFKEKCQQGLCPRQWDRTFPLTGKAKGGELVVNLAFQIMADGGLGLINSQPDGVEKAMNSPWTSSFARKLSKSSFSIMSPKRLRPKMSFTPKMGVT